MPYTLRGITHSKLAHTTRMLLGVVWAHIKEAARLIDPSVIILQAAHTVWSMMVIIHRMPTSIREALFQMLFTVWGMPCTLMAITQSRPVRSTTVIVQAIPTAWSIPRILACTTRRMLAYIREAFLVMLLTMWGIPSKSMAISRGRPAHPSIVILHVVHMAIP